LLSSRLKAGIGHGEPGAAATSPLCGDRLMNRAQTRSSNPGAQLPFFKDAAFSAKTNHRVARAAAFTACLADASSASSRSRHSIKKRRSNDRLHVAQDEGAPDGRRYRYTTWPRGHVPTHLANSVADSCACVRPPTYPISAATFRHAGP